MKKQASLTEFIYVIQTTPRTSWKSIRGALSGSKCCRCLPFKTPYPEETFDILVSLLTDEPRAVLDVGSGSGEIARRLVDRVERVDAVDFSLPMIEKGKTLPNGTHPRLRWIYGPAEEAPLDPPYALITAGQSMHWMDWDIVRMLGHR